MSYLHSDHLGTTSLVTRDTITGVRAEDGISEMRYDPWGEVRYSSSSTPQLATQYTFTGQYSYMDDPTTSGTTEGFGLMFYNARMYDPYLNHFTQPDTIVPGQYNSQSYDRYAYALNNPIRYTDPSGHRVCEDKGGSCKTYTQADQINDLKLIIKDQFKWVVKGKDWIVKELETIYQTGTDILAYVNNMTGGNGLDWINIHLGGVNIQKYHSNRNVRFLELGQPRSTSFAVG